MFTIISKAEQWWQDHAARFLRYSGVSLFNVIFGQLALLVLHGALGLAAWLANVIAVLVGSVPAFLLNKRFVWRHSGRVRFRSELLPFGAMNLAGLLLSTVAVATVAVATDSKVAVQLASLSAWAGLWVIKYMLLDRILTSPPAEAENAAAVAAR